MSLYGHVEGILLLIYNHDSIGSNEENVTFAKVRTIDLPNSYGLSLKSVIMENIHFRFNSGNVPRSLELPRNLRSPENLWKSGSSAVSDAYSSVLQTDRRRLYKQLQSRRPISQLLKVQSVNCRLHFFH